MTENFLNYALACLVIITIPGPTVMLAIHYASRYGKTAAVPVVMGVALGDALAIIFSFIGVGTILYVSAMLFNVLKFVGAAYLIYLGISLWRNAANLETNIPEISRKQVFRHSFIVTLLNPKGIIFHLSVAPLFIDPSQAVLGQLTVLAVIFVSMAILIILAWIGIAQYARRWLQKVQLPMQRISGGILMTFGVFTLFAKRQ